jgi:hypothetical protein
MPHDVCIQPYVGWVMELMDMKTPCASSFLTHDDSVSAGRGLSRSAAEDMSFAFDKMLVNALRHRGFDIPEIERGEGCHVDGGGWAKIDTALAYFNGDGYAEGARAMQGAASRKGEGEGEGEGKVKKHYAHALPAREERQWSVDVGDVLHCARQRQGSMPNHVPCQHFLRRRHSLLDQSPTRTLLSFRLFDEDFATAVQDG